MEESIYIHKGESYALDRMGWFEVAMQQAPSAGWDMIGEAGVLHRKGRLVDGCLTRSASLYMMDRMCDCKGIGGYMTGHLDRKWTSFWNFDVWRKIYCRIYYEQWDRN